MVNLRKWIFAAVSVLAVTSGVMAQIDVRGELDRLLEKGEYQSAQAFLRANGGTPQDDILLKAEIAVAKGNFGEAINIYRDLVTRYPEMIYLRIKLAQLLEANGNTESAIYHYTELQRRDSNVQGQNYYNERISALRATMKFGASMDAGLTPSSNVNNASSKKTGSFFGISYDLPEELLPQFGWHANLGVSAFARSRIADNQDFVYYGRLNIDRYTVETIDSTSAEIGMSWNYHSARNDFSLTPFVTRKLGDGKIYQTSGSFTNTVAEIADRDEDSWVRGVRLSGERRFAQGRSMFFALQLSDEVFDDQKNLGYSDNTSWNGKIGGTMLIDNRNRASLWLGLSGYGQIGAGGKYISQNNYLGKTVGARIETVWKNGWKSDFSYQYGDRQYQVDHLLTGGNAKREDQIFELSAGFSNQNWQVGKFIPKMDCTYSVNASNIEEFQTQGGGCGMSLTQNF